MFKKAILASLIVLLSACSSQPDLTYGSPPSVSLADDDADGVINARDLCAYTFEGAQVTNDGCPTVTDTLLTMDLNILFDNDSIIVKPQYDRELVKLADMINRTDEIKLELEGHASSVGSESYNLALSLKRAKEVKRLLVNNHNVDASKLVAVPFGESQLATQGGSESHHSKNRRVVLYIQIKNQKDLLRWNIFTTENKKNERFKGY
ncbi:OmpA family protein [Pseudoalteromonas sp. C2R02]|uniref:OmpA family protein n=1 Tax=Pseudoalteromonas sp. C2R02 TaxID=2841565 RepID=UPI001C093388|nr:OmpA family protein [Pseudoalteromonas sp. C2R02]MBU2971107.1 OmpA family protein [Pseudoalteromonas sp. C2R02]